MKKILIINGPNLDLLGKREAVYGTQTLAEIQAQTNAVAKMLGAELVWFQSPIEGEIIREIHRILTEPFDALVINPGGFSHTSVAILDALKIIKKPKVEVHLSNVHARESFRHTLLTAQGVDVIITGAQEKTYILALQAIL